MKNSNNLNKFEILTPQNEKEAEILLTRAKELAKSKEKINQTGNLEIIEFMLAGENYGIESIYVKEVTQLKNLTPLPGTPRFIMGIINHRGIIISVIDIKKLFDLPDNKITELNRTLILEHKELIFGILADAIVGVRTISKQNMQRTLPTLKGTGEEFLLGITNDRTIILDAHKLLNDSRIIVNEE